jgi:hypothetical protein
MKVINYNNREQFEALQLRIHNRLKGKRKQLRYNAERYCDGLERLDGSIDLLIDDENNLQVWMEIQDELTPAETNNIEQYNHTNYPQGDV